MEAVIDQAKRVASNANEAERRKIIDGLRDLSYSLETPDDTMQRVMYLVSAIEPLRDDCILRTMRGPVASANLKYSRRL